MKLPRMSAAAVATALAAVPLALVTACGGQASQPAAGPSPSVSTPAPASSRPAAPGHPGPGTSPPAASAQVLSSRLVYPWHWPNDAAKPGHVTHASVAPPVPELVRISVGSHPGTAGERPYDRMSFTFTTAFPGYRFEFVDKLVGDPSGKVIPLHGHGVLKIVFTGAQAHTADGERSSITSRPAPHIGHHRMADYAQGGDFEGVLTYGIGITGPAEHSGPRLAVRAYEVEKVTAGGQHHYTVAIDVDAGNHDLDVGHHD